MSQKFKRLFFFLIEVVVLSTVLYLLRGKLAASPHHEVAVYMPMLIDISFLAWLASFGGRLAGAFRIAPMAGKIVMGILAGPAVIGFVDPYAMGVEFARLLGVLIILFEAGLHFNMDLLKKNIKIATVVAFGGVLMPLVTFALMGKFSGLLGVSWLDFELDWLSAFFLGGVFTATSVGLSCAALKQVGKLESNLGNKIVGAAVIDDILGVVILTVLAKMSSAGGGGAIEAAHGAEASHVAEAGLNFMTFLPLIIGLLVFLVGTYMLWNMGVADKIAKHLNSKYEKHSTGIMTRFFFGMLVVGAGLAAVGGLEPVLGAFGIGVVLSKVDNEIKHEAWKKIEGYMDIFVGGFLVSIGTMLPREALVNPKVWLWAVIFTLLGFGGKYLVRYLFKNPTEGKSVAYAMAIRGEVGLVFVAVALANDALPPDVASASLLAVILVTIWGAIVFEKQIKKQVEEERLAEQSAA